MAKIKLKFNKKEFSNKLCLENEVQVKMSNSMNYIQTNSDLFKKFWLIYK